MGKKENIKVNLDEENIQEYDKALNTLKNDIDKLKAIKRKKKKLKKLEREKKDIMKKINRND